MEVDQISPEMLERLRVRKEADDWMAPYERISAEMTPEWRQDMDSRLKTIMQSNASLRSKLPKLTALMDEVHLLRVDHVACKPGCNACCYMKVDISDVEAERIGRATGRRVVSLRAGHRPMGEDELGRPDTPCPFLVEGFCSIYEHRPVVCRDLAVAAPDALACSFENMALARANDPRAVPVPQTQMAPLIKAWGEVVLRPGWVYADIRQFFPPEVA